MESNNWLQSRWFQIGFNLRSPCIEGAIDAAVARESERLAAQKILDGTQVSFPNAVYEVGGGGASSTPA